VYKIKTQLFQFLELLQQRILNVLPLKTPANIQSAADKWKRQVKAIIKENMGPIQNKLKEKVTINYKIVFNILNGKCMFKYVLHNLRVSFKSAELISFTIF
jgi:hypothetical protein